MKREATDITDIIDAEADVTKDVVNNQQPHWEKVFENTCSRFGDEPSYPAQKAAAIFEQEGKNKILELGCGQGRDTCFFASKGFHIYALDYAESGLKAVKEKLENLGFSDSVSIVTLKHDVRKHLPFENESFEACYSHMLYCMALTTDELEFLNNEIKRVLKPGGLNIYTARHTGDAQYKTGIHRGDDMYEIAGGFIVHFFSREKVKRLAEGYQNFEVEEFEEGELPKKLYLVTMRK